MTTQTMTPAERWVAMQAMPTHVVYMTRGGGRALITQSFGRIVDSLPKTLIVECVERTVEISRSDVYAVKAGRLSSAEMDAIFALHGSKQIHS